MESTVTIAGKGMFLDFTELFHSNLTNTLSPMPSDPQNNLPRDFKLKIPNEQHILLIWKSNVFIPNLFSLIRGFHDFPLV